MLASTDSTRIVTIERHILEQQQLYPDATGTLTNLLYDLALAGKIISSKITRAGLVEILGRAGVVNVQGEEVMKLDAFADDTIIGMTSHTGRVAVMASEEHPEIVTIPERYPAGKYVLLFDPLDGSANIDFNVSIGTIFAIYRRQSEAGPGTLADCLRQGRDLVAAGYFIYGGSTMLVYTTGNGVNGFTLDPNLGEFLLSHPNIRLPAAPKYYSANQGYEMFWSEGVQRYTQYLQGHDKQRQRLLMRYVGSLVGDFHRTLLAGGVFYYPADTQDPAKPHGKLRLPYEAAPLAFIAEQAGGYGSDGVQSILDLQPASLHQRTPLFIGNRDLVEKAEAFIREYDHPNPARRA